jgi:hypothetical protein
MRRVAMVLLGVSAVLLVAVVALVAGGPGPAAPQRLVRVQAATTSDDSRLVDLLTAACDERLFGTVTAAPEQVRVKVSTSSPVSGKLCAQEMVIGLDAPLGTRPLIDEATGTAVRVLKVPADQLQSPLRRRLHP